MTKINNKAGSAGREKSTIQKKMAAPGKSLGLYLHIPFCVRKCNYCDFLSFCGVTEEDRKAYFRSLIREMKYYSNVYNNKYYVESIFVGGGTPSLAEESLIDGMMTAARDSFSFADNAEITIECNPGTLTKDKLNAYLEAGINRLSIGAQSFDGRLLRYMGRIHTAEDFFKNYELARDCGFPNINIDLMFAIPGQTMKLWTDTLEKAVSLQPEHISFYSLQLEEGTPFFSMFQEGSLKQIEDELDRDMYHTAVGMLKDSGYEHYEISNAAKAGFRCRHNLKYWSMDDYLGLGLGAHSFMDGVRFSNTTDLQEYLHSSPSVRWEHKNTRADDISEYLFTGLRKVKGIDLLDFQGRFGVSLESIHGEAIEKYRKNGLLERKGGRLYFTEKGIDLSNTVLAEFV